MNYELKEIFRAITPDSIKNVPVINDAVKVFIEVLEERSKQSIDVSTYMENREIRRELFKTYLSDLYDVLDGIKTNQKVIDLISSRNSVYSGLENYEFISREVVNDMINRISDEHFIAFKNFREKKGTIKAIEYIYHLIATLVNLPTDVDYVVIEGENPFELKIEGSLPHEFYYFLIAPLAHPAGFTYQYRQSIVWELIDYFFPITIKYDVKKLIVNCISKHPDNPDLEIKNSTDFSDREVIDIRENSYVWPKSKKIYFGGDYEGEYLENLVYPDGHSTVVLYGPDGEETQFGDFCTLDMVIETFIIEDPVCNQLLTDLYSFHETHYDWNYNSETGEYGKDDSILDDNLSFLETHKSGKTPYLSWEKIPFWSIIGGYPHKWDNWVNNCYPDQFFESRTSKEDEDVLHLIGADHMFIWGKHEVIGNQFLNETIGEIPYVDDENLYGRTTYKGRDAILTKPGDLTLDAYIEGDAFHMTYMNEIPKVGHFYVSDGFGAHVIPDVFETSNGFGVDDYWMSNEDETVRFSGFVIRDDEYSFVFFDDRDSNQIFNHFLETAIKLTPWGYIVSDYWLIGEEARKRVAICNLDIKYGVSKETKFGEILLGDYRIKFDRWNIGDNIPFKYESPYKNRREFPLRFISEFFVGEGFIGETVKEITPGFWNNAFHQNSDKMDFIVIRDETILPDNNTNLPLVTSLDDDYSKSMSHIAFDENSDYFDIRNLRNGEEVNHNLQTREINFESDYSKSMNSIAFDENSDHLGFAINPESKDDYSIKYYENFHSNNIGDLIISKFTIFPDTSYNIGFGENSDIFDIQEES